MKTFSIDSIYNWYRTAIRDPKTRWWLVGLSLGYLLLPIDISPDFLPAIGWIDDGIIATLLVTELSQIVLERLKLRKAKAGQADTTETDAATPMTADTVEVKAVSIE